jgi:hypothetical protein
MPSPKPYAEPLTPDNAAWTNFVATAKSPDLVVSQLETARKVAGVRS